MIGKSVVACLRGGPGRRRRARAWAVFAGVAIGTPAAEATTLRVPRDFASIGEALRAAQEGDTVLVAPGTYRGPDNRDLGGGGVDVVIRSEGGPGVTLIDCEGEGRGLVFVHGETRASRVQGFTILHGRSETGGGGIWIRGSSPTLVDCVVRDCVVVDGFGGGILVESNSAPAISRCTVEGNRVLGTGDSAGGGIACNWFSDPLIEDVVVRNNQAENGGGIACLDFSSPVIEGSRISKNAAQVGAGGVYCFFNSSPVIRETEVTGNTAGGVGGGLRCRDLARPRLENCVVADNSAGRQGGGLQVFLAAPVISETEVTGNWSAFDGGGVHASGGSSFVLEDCLVAGNGAARAGGGIWCDASTVGMWSSALYGDCEGGLDPEPVRVPAALLAWGTERDDGALTYDPWRGEPVIIGCEFSGNDARSGAALWTRVDGGAHVQETLFWGCGPSTAWLGSLETIPCPPVAPAWRGTSMSSRQIDAIPVEDVWLGERQGVPCIAAGSNDFASAVGWLLTSGWIERFGDVAAPPPPFGPGNSKGPRPR